MSIFSGLNDNAPPLPYRVIRFFVWLFFPKFRVIGAEKLPDEPCVIVGNHSHMYGPVAGELYHPRAHYVWCAGEMMERSEVADYAFEDFWSRKPEWTHWFYRLLSRIIAPLSVLIFSSAHTIPVYRDTRVITTFRRSIERLREKADIIIYPECYEKHNNIIYKFRENFIDLARLFYRKTGVELKFVPMYLAPERRCVYFGEPVCYNADAVAAQERRRVCDALMDAVTELAVSLPEHTVVPYPNISKRFYKKNIPLEVYEDETATG